MLFNLIAATLLLLVLFNACFFGWIWWKTRDHGEGNGGTNGDGSPPGGEKSAGGDQSPFLIKPFLQLGTASGAGALESMEILWHAVDEPAGRWHVVLEFDKKSRGLFFMFQSLEPEVRHVRLPGGGPDAPAHKQFRVVVKGLKHNEHFFYRVFRNDVQVFQACGVSKKAPNQPFRYVVVGDVGDGKPGQARTAYQVWKAQPDLVVVPGDIAYKRGRVSEYLSKFFPIMNHDTASPSTGAPLLRHIPFVTLPGNHDFGKPELTDVPNFDEYADLFGYFIFWSQPLNGPNVGLKKHFQKLVGEPVRQKAFLEAAAGRYPVMASFSFDWGNTHFTVLDANPHMDWTDPDLRQWVKDDLARSNAAWKVVAFHQPSFTSHSRHRLEQRMRLLADVFQEGGVSIVYMGHAHWYERMYPLLFDIDAESAKKSGNPSGMIDGQFTIDRDFDGVKNTQPKGIVYLVTGAGGAKLQLVDLPIDGWLPFTHKLVPDRHSFTVVDVDDHTLSVRQIDEHGNEVDAFKITK